MNGHDAIIDKKYINHVNLIKNKLRSEYSTGHLSRNWNQAIINCFFNRNKDDWILLCQVDTIFKPQWYEKILNIWDKYNQYDFIQFGVGDKLCY